MNEPVIVSNTSPINYLVLIGEAGILGVLYKRVLIPETVLRELQHPHVHLYL